MYSILARFVHTTTTLLSLLQIQPLFIEPVSASPINPLQRLTLDKPYIPALVRMAIGLNETHQAKYVISTAYAIYLDAVR